MSVLPAPSMQLARSLPSVSLDELPALTAFQLFTMQLESNSTEAAVDAMKRLSVVALAMGRDEVLAELVPYLTPLANQQPDELLLILGQELPSVIQLVTNHYSPSHTSCVVDFLPLLERLAAVEETVVRDQAVVVLQTICHYDPNQDASSTPSAAPSLETGPFVAMAKRLAGADWFTAKVSVCGMMPAILSLSTTMVPDPHVDPESSSISSDPVVLSSSTLAAELLPVYKELCTDDTPMVRRAAAKQLGAVLKQAGWTPGADFAVATLPALVHDEQDSVRLLAVATLAHTGRDFGKHPTWTVQHWLPLLKDGSTDMSWRVRHNLAKHFSDVAYNLGIQNSDANARRFHAEQSLVMACFVSLLTDMEAEVRAAAVTHLARMVAWGGPQHFAAHLQPLLPALADDVVMEVRSKCALALMDAAHGGTLDDAVILQAFGPLLESFLQDEFHEVQLQVLTNLHKIAHLLPGLSGVVTSLMHMAKATNWRVREAVAKLLPHLAEARGIDFFASVLTEPAWLALLLDPVACVRDAIVKGMPLLVKVAGEEWTLTQLLPQHVRIYNANAHSYLIRITLLRAHIEMALGSQSTGALWKDAILQILRGLVDKVPNVRMVAATGLARIVPEGDTALVQAQIRPALEKRMQEEDDYDCRQACALALEQIK